MSPRLLFHCFTDRATISRRRFLKHPADCVRWCGGGYLWKAGNFESQHKVPTGSFRTRPILAMLNSVGLKGTKAYGRTGGFADTKSRKAS